MNKILPFRTRIFLRTDSYSKQGELDLIRICEDELLLALPMVPKHKIENCSLGHHKITNENNITNPFSLLLKGEDKLNNLYTNLK